MSLSQTGNPYQIIVTADAMSTNGILSTKNATIEGKYLTIQINKDGSLTIN